MCTLVLAWQVFEDAPIAVAANRDEALGRPSEPPTVLEEDPRVVAPRDAEAGGTWFGYNEHGLFVAITNRWVDLEGDRSRGLLVRDALRHESAEEAARFVEDAVERDDYAGFNLVVADARAAIFFEWHGGLMVRNFAQGVHVVVNVGADGNFFVPESREGADEQGSRTRRDADEQSSSSPGSRTRRDAGEEQALNAMRLNDALQPEPGEDAADWVERAAGVIRDHEYGVCVHREDLDFGTRSSSLLVLGDDGSAVYQFADGPPCETPYEPVDVA